MSGRAGVSAGLKHDHIVGEHGATATEQLGKQVLLPPPVPAVIAMAPGAMLTAALAGFGRTVSEVGAIIIVGGNIAAYTRTMTTAIVLETSMGDLPLALGLGLVLIGLTTMICAGAFALTGRSNR